MTSQIALDIDAQKEQAIFQKIEELKALLPEGLISLTVHEKQGMAKLKDKTVAFVEKSIDSAHQNPALLPTFVDIAKLEKDFHVFITLSHIVRALNQITGTLNDTAVFSGNEAYTGALSIYGLAKNAALRGVKGAKGIVDELSIRFPQRGKKKDKV